MRSSDDKLLVIAYGNPLREDDGVGWHVAARLEAGAPQLPVIAAFQLLPEMALRMGEADTVVFIDASANAPAGEIDEIEILPDGVGLWDLHSTTPVGLLGATRALCGRAPRATLITIGGEWWGHGEGLSPRVAAAVSLVAARVIELCAREAVHA